MKKILTVGGAMYDAFLDFDPVDTLALSTQEHNASYVIVQAGRKVELKNISYHCGGGAANSAVSFAKMGFDVDACFKIGHDYAGDFIVNTLQRHAVGVDAVVRIKDVSTGHSFILSHPQGDRPILIHRGANARLEENNIPEKIISTSDVVYVTSLSNQAASVLLPLVTCAKKHNKKIAVNPGTSQLSGDAALLRMALPHIDTLILNSYEAQLLMATSFVERYDEQNNVPGLLRLPMGKLNQCFSLHSFFKTIHDIGPSLVVVTHGAEGVYVSDGKTIFFHPSIKSEVVSSVGAGDAFASAFVAYIVSGQSIEVALSAGIINSSCVITHVGAQTGLLTKEELDNKTYSFDKHLVKKYSLNV